MTKKKTIDHYSGIGGQAVLEGVMMKNQDTYAVAVRKPDGKIEVKTEEYKPKSLSPNLSSAVYSSSSSS